MTIVVATGSGEGPAGCLMERPDGTPPRREIGAVLPMLPSGSGGVATREEGAGRPGYLAGFITGGRRPEAGGRRLIPATMVGGPRRRRKNISAKALSNLYNLAKSAPKSALSAQPNLIGCF